MAPTVAQSDDLTQPVLFKVISKKKHHVKVNVSFMVSSSFNVFEQQMNGSLLQTKTNICIHLLRIPRVYTNQIKVSN